MKKDGVIDKTTNGAIYLWIFSLALTAIGSLIFVVWFISSEANNSNASKKNAEAERYLKLMNEKNPVRR